MDKIVLTSFRDAPNHPGTKYSIARWEPTGLHYPKFPVAIQPYLSGKPLRADIGPNEYRVKYELILKQHTHQLIHFFEEKSWEGDLILLCWCTLERQHSSWLLCHRILLGYWIENWYSDFEVVYADGADHPIWERR